MARLHRIITTVSALAAVAAGLAGARPAGAQGAQGGSARTEDVERRRRELAVTVDRARSDEVARLQKELAVAADRVRDLVRDLQRNGEFQAEHAQALAEATRALEAARPATVEFTAAAERMNAVVRRTQFAIAEDEELKRAVKDLVRLQQQLTWQVRVPGVRPGYLGVSFASQQTISRDGNVVMRFDEHPQIIAVEAESPAAKAGVRPGDVLLSFDGEDVTRNPVKMNELLVPGRRIRMRLRREGRTMEVPVQVRTRPEAYRVFVRAPQATPGEEWQGFTWTPDMPGMPPTPPTPPVPPAAIAPRPPRGFGGPTTFVDDDLAVTIERRSDNGRTWERVILLGAELTQLDEQQRDALDVDRGVLVFRVARRSAFEPTGLRAFDVIVKVGDRRVSEPTQVYEVVKRLNDRDEKQVEVEYLRDGKSRKGTLKW